MFFSHFLSSAGGWKIQPMHKMKLLNVYDISLIYTLHHFHCAETVSSYFINTKLICPKIKWPERKTVWLSCSTCILFNWSSVKWKRCILIRVYSIHILSKPSIANGHNNQHEHWHILTSWWKLICYYIPLHRRCIIVNTLSCRRSCAQCVGIFFFFDVALFVLWCI